MTTMSPGLSRDDRPILIAALFIQSPTRPEVDLTLTNVGALTLDLKEAGIKGSAIVNVTTDGSVTLKIRSATYTLPAGTQSLDVT